MWVLREEDDGGKVKSEWVDGVDSRDQGLFVLDFIIIFF